MHTCIHVSYTYVAADCIQVCIRMPTRTLSHNCTKRRYCVGRLSATELARARIFQNLIQNLSGPRSGENFSKPQWVPACWLCITPIPMVPQPHFPSLRRSAHADRFAKCPPRVLRAAQPRTQPRTRTYAVYPPLRLTALAKF